MPTTSPTGSNSSTGGSGQNGDNEFFGSLTDNETADLTPQGYVSLLTVILQVVLFFAILFGNGLVLFAITATKNLQSRTSYFIAQLAIADILVALILPFHIALFLNRELLNNFYICLLRYTTVLVAFLLSLLCLLCLTYDRLLALTYPLHYQLKTSTLSQRRSRAP